MFPLLTVDIASRQTRGHGHHAAPTGGTGGTSGGSSNDPQPVDSGYGYQHHGRSAAGYAAGQPSPMIGYGGEADPQNQRQYPIRQIIGFPTDNFSGNTRSDKRSWRC